MSIESTLYSALSGDATIASLVGSRIYMLRVPEEAPAPFISFHNISGMAFNKLGSAPDKDNKVFEIGCVSPDFDEALSIADAVKSALGTDYGYLDSQGAEFYEKTQEYRVWLHWSLIG